MKNPTVRQFLGWKTNKYRSRYRKVLDVEMYGYPEYKIPRADHAFCQGPYMISRPYGMFGEDIEELVEWASKHSLEFYFTGPSSWHPATLLLLVYRPEFVREFNDAAAPYGDAFTTSLLEIMYRDSHSEINRVYRGRYETGIFILNSRKSKDGVGFIEGPEGVESYLSTKGVYSLSQGLT